VVAADHDHPALPRRAHYRQEPAEHDERGAQVGGHGAVEIFQAVLPDGRRQRPGGAGGVDHHVHPPVAPFQQGIKRDLSLAGIAHIGGERQGAAAQPRISPTRSSSAAERRPSTATSCPSPASASDFAPRAGTGAGYERNRHCASAK
jgi:hypothetical protein